MWFRSWINSKLGGHWLGKKWCFYRNFEKKDESKLRERNSQQIFESNPKTFYLTIINLVCKKSFGKTSSKKLLGNFCDQAVNNESISCQFIAKKQFAIAIDLAIHILFRWRKVFRFFARDLKFDSQKKNWNTFLIDNGSFA